MTITALRNAVIVFANYPIPAMRPSEFKQSDDDDDDDEADSQTDVARYPVLIKGQTSYARGQK